MLSLKFNLLKILKSHRNACAVFIFITIIGGCIILFFSNPAKEMETEDDFRTVNNDKINIYKKDDLYNPSFWQNVNLVANEIPLDVQETAKKLKIVTKTVKVDENDVFYREVEPFKGFDISTTITLLLLHGAAFSSQTWEELKTIQLLSAMGYRTVAIDLPGFGNSPKADVDKQTFISKLVKALNLNSPVVISPSLSGYYSIPYLLQNWSEMGGYVPVAPVGTDLLENIDVSTDRSDERLQRVPDSLKQFLLPPLPNLDKYLVPAMVVYGEKDRKKNSALLTLLPCSQAREIPKGRHPAYLDNPELWHQLLYNFLKQIEISKTK